MSRFINTELKSDSDLDSEKVRAKFDNELMAKLEIWFWFSIRHFTFNLYVSVILSKSKHILAHKYSNFFSSINNS